MGIVLCGWHANEITNNGTRQYLFCSPNCSFPQRTKIFQNKPNRNMFHRKQRTRNWANLSVPLNPLDLHCFHYITGWLTKGFHMSMNTRAQTTNGAVIPHTCHTHKQSPSRTFLSVFKAHLPLPAKFRTNDIVTLTTSAAQHAHLFWSTSGSPGAFEKLSPIIFSSGSNRRKKKPQSTGYEQPLGLLPHRPM